jgi:hypothetical protein
VAKRTRRNDDGQDGSLTGGVRTSKPGGSRDQAVRSAAIPYLTAALRRTYADQGRPYPRRITVRTRVLLTDGRRTTVEQYLRWLWIFDVRGALR